MVLSRKQLIATAFLAVLIVASVMVMPRTPVDSPRDNGSPRSAGMIATAPTDASELAPEQVKDLTYN